MNEKICCIFNLAPHYREPIYKMMDKELDCDFYFGDKVNTAIKIMDVHSLNGYKKTVRNKHLFNTGWIWQTATWSLVFKPYKHFILTGDPYIISNHLIALLARILNKKVYLWSHGMKGDANPRKRLLQRFLFTLSHKALLYGEHSKKNMIDEGFKENKLIPIYNSLDYDKQLEVRKNLKESDVYSNHFNNNHPTLIYIGRLQKSKKLDLLITSLRDMKQKGVLCNLAIIGKDVDGTNLEVLVTEFQLEDQVWFYGACYDEEEIAKLIYNADLCVSPGPIGLTALHAMTYGTPIITNDNFSKQMPEFEVIQNNETGVFYKEGDLSDLTNKITQWIGLGKTQRNNIRKKAYSIIDAKYNPHYQIGVLKDLINVT